MSFMAYSILACAWASAAMREFWLRFRVASLRGSGRSLCAGSHPGHVGARGCSRHRPTRHYERGNAAAVGHTRWVPMSWGATSCWASCTASGFPSASVLPRRSAPRQLASSSERRLASTVASLISCSCACQKFSRSCRVSFWLPLIVALSGPGLPAGGCGDFAIGVATGRAPHARGGDADQAFGVWSMPSVASARGEFTIWPVR